MKDCMTTSRACRTPPSARIAEGAVPVQSVTDPARTCSEDCGGHSVRGSGTRRLGRVNPSVSPGGISGVPVMQSITPSIGVQLAHRPPRGWFAYLPGKA